MTANGRKRSHRDEMKGSKYNDRLSPGSRHAHAWAGNYSAAASYIPMALVIETNAGVPLPGLPSRKLLQVLSPELEASKEEILKPLA